MTIIIIIALYIHWKLLYHSFLSCPILSYHVKEKIISLSASYWRQQDVIEHKEYPLAFQYYFADVAYELWCGSNLILLHSITFMKIFFSVNQHYENTLQKPCPEHGMHDEKSCGLGQSPSAATVSSIADIAECTANPAYRLFIKSAPEVPIGECIAKANVCVWEEQQIQKVTEAALQS